MVFAVGFGFGIAALSVVAPAESMGADKSAKQPRKSPSELRVDLESGVAEIGQIEADARKNAETARLRCVVDKRKRAEIVLERATEDFALYESGGSGERGRKFEKSKLQTEADKMQNLVELARNCQGAADEGRPEADVANSSNEPSQVGPEDPSDSVPGNNDVPPPADPGRGPVSSAVR